MRYVCYHAPPSYAEHISQSYFDQAAEVSRLLNIKLTKKTWSGQRIHMCGFPLMHLNKYLKMLVQEHSRFVAMCEEFPRNPALGAKGGFDRRVVRIVTPGTLIDEPFLNPYENNYLLSVVPSSTDLSPREWPSSLPVGLAWIDVSTGEFYTKSTTLAGLRDELVRVSPKEVILDARFSKDDANPIRRAVSEEDCFLSFSAPPKTPSTPADSTVTTQASPDDVTADVEPLEGLLPVPLASEETGAVELLTAFMHANLMDHMPSLSSPAREASCGRMQIDTHTVKALELREGMREGGTTGSLLSVIKRTVTTSGTRLLTRWLCEYPCVNDLCAIYLNTRRFTQHICSRDQRPPVSGCLLPRQTLPSAGPCSSPTRGRRRDAHRADILARTGELLRPFRALYHCRYLVVDQGEDPHGAEDGAGGRRSTCRRPVGECRSPHD